MIERAARRSRGWPKPECSSQSITSVTLGRGANPRADSGAENVGGRTGTLRTLCRYLGERLSSCGRCERYGCQSAHSGSAAQSRRRLRFLLRGRNAATELVKRFVKKPGSVAVVSELN